MSGMFHDFDERFYTEYYPDIARAIENGSLKTAFDHYLRAGRKEGRQRFKEFDHHWYRTMYPLVVEDVKAGLAVSSFDHFDRIGRYRGYLPNSRAERPANAAAPRSKFGGFWTDNGNALDIVAGREDLNTLNSEQAELLRHWIHNGFVILRQGADTDVIDQAAEEIEEVYSGSIPQLKFLCEPISKSMMGWSDSLTGLPAKAIDVHYYSQPVRDLVFSRKILDFLHLLFERRVMATQSLTFWRGSSQQVHQDTAYVTYSIPCQFVATWIALEDVVVNAGELFYFPGSHRFDDFLFDGKHKSLAEARRMNAAYKGEGEARAHVESLKAGSANHDEQVLLAKRGDVLVWHADLAHGGRPISVDRTRKSIVTHYCPKEIVPLYFERTKRVPLRNSDGSFYASSYYD